MLHTKFRFIWQSGFRGKDFQKSTIQKKEQPVVAMFVNESGRNQQSIIEDLPQMLSTKFPFIWESGFRGEDFFRNQPIRNKNGLWQPYLLPDWNEMSNLYRGPSKDASYQAVSEEKIYQKSTNQKQELLVVAMFVNGSGRNQQSLQRTFHRCFLPSFSSFGWFQRRRLKCEKLMDDRHQVMAKAHIAFDNMS